VRYKGEIEGKGRECRRRAWEKKRKWGKINVMG
jgi:hypothetical protein